MNAYKIMFIYMGAENLGIEYLASEVRRAGHEAALAFDPAVFSGHLMWNSPRLARLFDLRPALIKKILYYKPDAAAFSCFTGNYKWALSIAEELKSAAPGIKTVFGGVHVTAVPNRAIGMPQVDAILTGEADETFPALLDMWREGKSEPPPGVYIKTGGEIIRNETKSSPVGLDSLPFPAKELFYDIAPALQNHYMIMSARGCPYNCTYCYKSLSAELPPGAKSVRRRSVENVMAELREAVGRWKIGMVVFRDDVFTLKKKWLAEFTAEYKKHIGLPYFCYTHPAALDAETADLIKEGGCEFVTMGVQSADEDQRRRVLNRRYTNDQVRDTAALLKKRKILLSVDHIIGIPGDTEESLRKAAALYNEIRPDRLLTFWLTFYPGTEMMKIGLENGFLTPEDVEKIENGEGGHRYSGGGGAGSGNQVLRRFAVFFTLIPLMPSFAAAWALKLKLYRVLPGSFGINNLLLSARALLKSDKFFMYNIKFALSRKKAP